MTMTVSAIRKDLTIILRFEKEEDFDDWISMNPPDEECG